MLRRARRRLGRAVRRESAPQAQRPIEPIAGTYCCLACRLLQTPTTSCAHCGAAMVAPLPLLRELLRYRDMSLAAERDLGLLTGLVAGGSLVVPLLAPLAAIGLAALLVRVPLRRRRARLAAEQDVSPVVPAPARPPPGAVTRSGLVRPLYGCSIGSIFDRAPMVVEDVALASTGALGGTLFRTLHSAPFVLEPEHEEPVVVTGVVRWLPGSPLGVRRRALAPADPVLAELGLPADLHLRAELVVDGVAPGAAIRVDVSGVLVEERVPELATYRDGAPVRVMRGVPGRPVLVARAAPRTFVRVL